MEATKLPSTSTGGNKDGGGNPKLCDPSPSFRDLIDCKPSFSENENSFRSIIDSKTSFRSILDAKESFEDSEPSFGDTEASFRSILESKTESETFRSVLGSKPSWEAAHKGNVLVLKTEMEGVDDSDDDDDDDDSFSSDLDSDEEIVLNRELQNSVYDAVIQNEDEFQNGVGDFQNVETEVENNDLSSQSWNAKGSFDMNMFLGMDQCTAEDLLADESCAPANANNKTVHLVSPKDILASKDAGDNTLVKSKGTAAATNRCTIVNKIGIQNLNNAEAATTSNKVSGFSTRCSLLLHADY